MVGARAGSSGELTANRHQRFISGRSPCVFHACECQLNLSVDLSLGVRINLCAENKPEQSCYQHKY